MTHIHAQSGFLDPRIYQSYGDADFLEKVTCRGVNRAGTLDNSIFVKLAESVRHHLAFSMSSYLSLIRPFVPHRNDLGRDNGKTTSRA